jgi:hypothetical protein
MIHVRMGRAEEVGIVKPSVSQDSMGPSHEEIRRSEVSGWKKVETISRIAWNGQLATREIDKSVLTAAPFFLNPFIRRITLLRNSSSSSTPFSY